MLLLVSVYRAEALTPRWQSAPCQQVVDSSMLQHYDQIRVACLAGSDTLDRFIWVLSFLARNDFVVVPVDQLQYDDGVLENRHQWGKVRCTPHRTSVNAKTANCMDLGRCMLCTYTISVLWTRTAACYR
jgi:hypothetical protein